MKHRFVVCGGNISRVGSLGLLVGGISLMVAVSSAMAQNPGPSGSEPSGRPGIPGGMGGPPPPPTAGMNLEITEGSASYRVTEQFVGIDFPNDAIGTSTTVAGTIGIARDGTIMPGSKLSVDLRNLKSDQDYRDNFIKKNTFETDKYPMAEFVPTKITGLPLTIPMQGQSGFVLTGKLMIHGVTKEVVFQGIATFGRDNTIAGRAKTNLTFDTFGLTVPKIGRLMSVDNKIDLNLVFKFKRS
jgi:polyisoprenoid-binding protein YceI